jgi:hypothetical protein
MKYSMSPRIGHIVTANSVKPYSIGVEVGNVQKSALITNIVSELTLYLPSLEVSE